MAWTSGFIVGPLIAGAALGAGQSTPLFVGLIAASALGALGALRLRAHLPPRIDVVGPWSAEPARRESGAFPVLVDD